ncbi:MAG: calmodulin, partial [Pirellulales bacterium]|nr:calmodulin [Pirellulales bacterium]
LPLADLESVTPDDASLLAILQPLDADRNGRFDLAEVERLRSRPPDLDLLVRFDNEDAKKSELSLLAVADDLDAAHDGDSALGGVDVVIGQTTINFSAVQASASDQISLGAVVDGYPLLPGLDPNDDGRFTLRERRELSSRLMKFDLDGDGQLTPREARPPVRVCLGLGAIVHRELARVRTIKSVDGPDRMVGPEWFVRMDRNKDNDLVRGEFPGTDQQFQALDADGDQLVSAAEALRFDNQSTSPESE